MKKDFQWMIYDDDINEISFKSILIMKYGIIIIIRLDYINKK